MALTSALFTGLSGLDVNQTRLGVVANNIANVNTVAFKSSRALFKPQFYVTDGAGTAPSDTFGGTNPSQRGLGAEVATIEKDFTTGALEPTGRQTDLALDGDGFFVVDGTEGQRFTRDGSFSLNAVNQLVTTDGGFVQGYGVDANANVIRGSLQNLTIPIGATTPARATSESVFEGNLNASGDVASGASILTSQLLTTVGGTAPPTTASLLTNLASTATPATALLTAGEVFTLRGQKGGRELAERSFTVTAASTVADFNTFLQQGMGVNTTVPDDGNPLTPTAGATIETDATDPNSARLVLAGNLGAENSLSISGTALSTPSGLPFTFSDGANAAGIASNPVGESVHTTFIGYDSLGTPVAIDITAVLESKADTGNVWRFYATSGDDTDPELALGTGTLTFNSQGQLTASTGTTLSIDRANTGAGSPLVIGLDFDKLTSLTSRDSSLISTHQDGSQRGTLDTFSIGTDGTIVGSFSNGQTRTLGQVAVAKFANNRGLVDKGGNMFVPGGDSGDPLISAAMELGSGAIRSGTLEQSNVDLSEEFVNMIISSTGFSASSRVITTSDRLITELLNSSR